MLRHKLLRTGQCALDRKLRVAQLSLLWSEAAADTVIRLKSHWIRGGDARRPRSLHWG